MAMRFVWVAAVGILLAGCGARNPAPGSGEVLVMAAASLSEAFGEMGAAFEAANPGARVRFNFAGSQQLAQQIAAGAPADVFASANARQMAAAEEAGLLAEEARVFAENRLVIVTPGDDPGEVEGPADLAKPGLRLILAAEEVPAGEYTLEFLDQASQAEGLGPAFREGVLANVVSYEENVRTVLTKVSLGEADAGVVYASDAAGPAGEAVRQVAIPEAWNVAARYPIAVLREAGEPEMARRFVAFVLSPAGREILGKYGFE